MGRPERACKKKRSTRETGGCVFNFALTPAISRPHQTLSASGGRTQRRARRPHVGILLVTRRAARELLRARAAHAAAGEHQTAGQGFGAVESLTHSTLIRVNGVELLKCFKPIPWAFQCKNFKFTYFYQIRIIILCKFKGIDIFLD